MADNPDWRTIIIAILLSVIVSTGIMNVPQVQDALCGPKGDTGPQGIQGIQGEPGEVTQAELDELAIRIDELESTIADMDAELDDHLSKIENLWRALNEESGNRFENDESMLQVISDLKTFTNPDFDSGWITLPRGTSKFICTLDDTNVFVYMIGRTDSGKIHQHYYGGDYYNPAGEVDWLSKGAYWYIDGNDKLSIFRWYNDEDNAYDEVRVLVWHLTPESEPAELAPIDDDLVIIP